MRYTQALLVCALLSSVPTLAAAQDFGVVESAETINQGNVKIRANPMLIFGKNGQDSTPGIAVVVGYGFTKSFDAEGGIAAYDGVTFFGGNGEYWLMKHEPFDFSISAGLHGRRGSQTVDVMGVDLTLLPSKHVGDRLDLYSALDFAFESVSSKNGGGHFKTVHVVPGVEYGITHDLDLVAEIGIALNDSANHYVSGGFAYYFR